MYVCVFVYVCVSMCTCVCCVCVYSIIQFTILLVKWPFYHSYNKYTNGMHNAIH